MIRRKSGDGPSEALLTPDEAAKVSHCSPRFLRDMARRGELPVYRLGSGPRARLRFKWSELEAALKAQGSGPRR